MVTMLSSSYSRISSLISNTSVTKFGESVHEMCRYKHLLNIYEYCRQWQTIFPQHNSFLLLPLKV